MATPEQDQVQERAPDQQAQPSAAPSRPVRSRSRWRWLKWIVATLVLLVLLAAGLVFTALRTDWGARTGWQLATRVMGGALSGEYAGGSVARGLDLRNIRYHDAQQTITIDRVRGAWDFRFTPRKLTITSLELGHVDLTLQPSPKKSEPLKLPEQIRLPLAVELQRLAIDEVLVHQDGATTRIADVLLRASSDRVHHTLDLEKATTPFGAAAASLKLTGDAPFPLTGSASLNGAWEKLDYNATTRLDGTLQALGVTLKASGGNFNADARIDATPFSPLPFTRARVAVAHLNPRMFNAAAPQADLAIDADIAPLPLAAGASLADIRVSGPISVTNARPGSIDQELLPLESLKASATLDAQRQRLDGLVVALRGGARLEGDGEYRADGSGELQVEARGLDLHALHAAVRPTRLNGPLKASLAGDTQQVTLKLDGPPFAIHADAGITPQEITLRSAHLEAGKARLDASGKLGRDEQAAYSIDGALADFNPAAFLATVQPPPAPASRRKGAPPAKPATIPEADINMRFAASGKLKPELQARVRFDIADSSYAGLPMRGGGRLELAGKLVSDSDVTLSVAGNQVAVKGGFGAPGKQLAFAIDAPAIDRLGFGLAGALNAKGQLAGTLERPLVQADIQGERLAFGEYRAARIGGKVDTRGIPGSDPQAQVKVALQANGVRAAELQLDELQGDIDGTYASHTVRLQANGKYSGEALALTLAAAGKLQQLPAGLAWDGTVRTLENRGVPRLQMQQPLAVHYAPGEVTLGATRLEVEKAQVSLNSLDYRADGAIRSQGAITALDVGHMLALWKRIGKADLPVASDLVLDAGWNFTLGDTASGLFQVERKRGDVSLPVGGRTTQLDLKQLRLRGDFAGQALRINAALDTARLGNVNAQGQVGLQQSGPRLMPGPDSTLNMRIAAALPELGNLSSLTGPRIALKGKIAANVTVGGTVGAPLVSGELAGDQLALTLYDQGVRLRDGVARITLADNVAELRELVFRGGDGTLRASGRLPLDEARNDITATIVADKLQLLADPSAQLTLSGQAKVANVGKQLQVTGKFTVDRGLFNLPEKSAPKLGDDVVVYRNGAKPAAADTRASAAERPASPYAPRVDMQVDLGDDFRFRGSGADLRLAGTLAIRTGPNEPLQALGTINIAEGKYEAFGAVLNIERGLLNFTGPLTNPNVNILAMRRNQDVAAGVQVTGTVQLPRVQLVSDPNVADEEKLSWLVFGHGGSGGTGGAQAAARGAATGLLNKLGGEKVAKRLGLDELSFGSSKTGLGSEQVVNLGKNITERLAIGYEQSLAGAASVLKLTYQLSRAWSVVLRGGQIAGLDLSYSRRFDRFGEDSVTRK
ncbi:translocation/assembly module TamB domain-containing protein [Noviherbaspirillum suwonense]|uniref:Autotransporter secretion inner membrane protein TamB n=1 Tax=Noviherbaspirillum suwonense TaxID=1224511 RepID=A0ABY1PXI9_9BURK|nr:translocation/assembly module TamB domain-containing protein [Noviherbaspirillum suwonense]SMP51650.1 autotransporter secretion inner membrane protein TamB [Noviherbaspirillum suwonense]